jgi:hypothetical protein
MTFALPNIEERLLTPDDWFNDIVAKLREHQVQLRDKTLSKDIELFYNTFLVGNQNEIASLNKKLSQQHFVYQIITKYVSLIGEIMPEQLAFSFNDSEILVWAELKNDDWNSEKALIMSAAAINSEYHRLGYDITTTFVEERDGLDIPQHYQPFKIKEKSNRA